MAAFRHGQVIRIMATRLRSLSLKSLVELGEGDIVIGDNKDLCYVNSINWDSMRIGDKSGSTNVYDNMNPAACGQ